MTPATQHRGKFYPIMKGVFGLDLWALLPKRVISFMPGSCKHCGSPLIQIDHYRDRLTGCLECNLWEGDKSEIAAAPAGPLGPFCCLLPADTP
jgi:hypothetical protein